jgi:LacI family transcriptional regulator
VKHAAGKIRLKDIADLAGVSIGTVDRVIHNRGEVAESTKQRVQDILRETNYSPNLIASVLKSKKRFHIVTLLPEPSETNSYWLRHPKGIMKAIQELEPFHVTLSQVNFNMESEKDFMNKTTEVLKMDPDGVLLAPIFKSESQQFCTYLEHKNIPFVFIDGYIENTGFLAYIGEDVFRSGRVAGQLTDIITPHEKDILAVNLARNIKNVHHLDKRTRGFFDYLNTTGKNRGKKLNINIPDISDSTIEKAMDKAFKENPGIGSVFVSGSRSYLIARYLDIKSIRSVNITGYDLLDQNIKYLKSGITLFLIGQRPEEQAYKGIKKLFDFLSLNRIPDRMEYLPVDIITAENIDLFIL